MTMPGDPRVGESRRVGLALLWALPLALIVGIGTWIPTDIALCGISGCSGGGFGVSWDPAGGLIGLAIGGAIVALPIVIVRWTTSRALRLAIAVAAGLVFALAGWIYLVPLAAYR
ncbi:MAG: hypothetical protein JWM70_1630 [Microbacteriaceae bacterium]|nr:hypothetical protein [Microbacteriaceae bacterium]